MEAARDAVNPDRMPRGTPRANLQRPIRCILLSDRGMRDARDLPITQTQNSEAEDGAEVPLVARAVTFCRIWEWLDWPTR